MTEAGDRSTLPQCPALLICQESRITPNLLFDILRMMNGIGITEFPADVHFTVHFALTEGEGSYRVALFLESDKEDLPAQVRHQLWDGDVSLKSRIYVHERSVPVVVRFFAPGQCRLALYVNGVLVARRPLSILKPKTEAESEDVGGRP